MEDTINVDAIDGGYDENWDLIRRTQKKTISTVLLYTVVVYARMFPFTLKIKHM